MCEFFHIPFQSGDNDILRQMKCGACSPACDASGKHAGLRLMCSMHLWKMVCCVCRRGYTHERYRRIIDSIRRHIPDASISGDAIVGFPGKLYLHHGSGHLPCAFVSAGIGLLHAVVVAANPTCSRLLTVEHSTLPQATQWACRKTKLSVASSILSMGSASVGA